MSEGISRTIFASTEAFSCCRVAVAEGSERSVGAPHLSKVRTFAPDLRGTPLLFFLFGLQPGQLSRVWRREGWVQCALQGAAPDGRRLRALTLSKARTFAWTLRGHPSFLFVPCAARQALFRNTYGGCSVLCRALRLTEDVFTRGPLTGVPRSQETAPPPKVESDASFPSLACSHSLRKSSDAPRCMRRRHLHIVCAWLNCTKDPWNPLWDCLFVANPVSQHPEPSSRLWSSRMKLK